MKTLTSTSALLALFFTFSSIAYAQPTQPSDANKTRTYGYILSATHDPVYQDGFFYVSPADQSVFTRFDYEDSENTGAHTLQPNTWVVIDGYVTTFFGCFDNGTNLIKPYTIWRWNTSTNQPHWDIWNRSSQSWVPWP